MKHLIIGCGISGIHIGIQLLDKGIDGNEILILEKCPYNYSKIFTIKDNVTKADGKHEEIILELGPSVFHSNQQELIKLIEKLGLTNTLKKVDPKEKAFFVYPNLTSDEAKTRWKELKKRVLEEGDYFLTLKEASKKILNKKEYDLLKTCWGEWYEVCDCNLKILKNSLENEGEYIIMEGGFDQIIKRGIKFLEDNNVTIKFEHGVKKITEELIIIDCNNNIYKPDKLYICVNYKGLKTIKTNIHLLKEYLSLGKSKECIRFYIYFKKDINIPYKFIMGKFLGKYSIRTSKNLWLIAYPDGLLSNYLNNIPKLNIIKDWLKMINYNFNLDLKLKDIGDDYYMYWDDAYCILKNNSINKSEQIYNELKDNNIIVTSLPKDKGEHTAWMEGHLFNIS
jgi:hypothetical protein